MSVQQIVRSKFDIFKKGIFYFIALVIALGNIVDLYILNLDTSDAVFYVNHAYFFFILILVLLFYFKRINISLAYILLIYIFFINMFGSLYIIRNKAGFDAFFLRETLIVAVIIPFAGFLIHKIHVFIIGAVYFLFFIFMVIVTHNTFLIQNFLIIFLVFMSYTGLVYYMLDIIADSFMQQEELIHILEMKNTKINFQREELQVLNDTKDKILSIIAHDLKNPFSSIILSSEMLNSEYNKLGVHQSKQLVQSIYSSAKQANNLLDNLLQWSRSKTQELEFKPSIFNLVETVQQNITLYENSLTKKKLEINLRCDDDMFLTGDERMIDTIFRNLISNAIKFTPDGGEIKVCCRFVRDEVVCSVVDTGVGISPENIAKLFKVDSHFSTKGTRQENGTGLGLVLCKEFVEQHGGHISVTSEVGKGSGFSFSIPQKKIKN